MLFNHRELSLVSGIFSDLLQIVFRRTTVCVRRKVICESVSAICE